MSFFFQETLRMTRTKKLLWCIGIVFLLCWIPINFINLLSDSLLLLNMQAFLLLDIFTFTFYTFTFVGKVFLLFQIPINFINLLSDYLLLLNMYAFILFFYIFTFSILTFIWIFLILSFARSSSTQSTCSLSVTRPFF